MSWPGRMCPGRTYVCWPGHMVSWPGHKCAGQDTSVLARGHVPWPGHMSIIGRRTRVVQPRQTCSSARTHASLANKHLRLGHDTYTSCLRHIIVRLLAKTNEISWQSYVNRQKSLAKHCSKDRPFDSVNTSPARRTL